MPKFEVSASTGIYSFDEIWLLSTQKSQKLAPEIYFNNYLFRSDEKIVCPRVPLAACLERYSAPEEVQDFYSSAINARTTAIKYISWTV